MTTTAPSEISPARPPRTGRTALTMAIVVLVASLALSITVGLLAVRYAVHTATGASVMLHPNPNDPFEGVLTVIALLHVLAGTGFGITAFVLGIMAVSTGRGRRPGGWAIALAAVAPILSLALFLGIALSG